MERLHKVSAGFVFAFLCLHFANHLIGLEGIDAHTQFMDAVRLVYRHPIVEMAVMLAFVIQALSGFALSKTIWRNKKDAIHQTQAASGTYLMIFIILHLLWVGVGRLVFNLDTNFYYVAAGLMSPTWKYVFFPFYGLGIFALFLHMGCILYDIFKKTSKPAGRFFLIVTAGLGVYVAYLLLMMYSGQFYHVAMPEEDAAVFGAVQTDAPPATPVKDDAKSSSTADAP